MICNRSINIAEETLKQHTGGNLWDGAVILAKYLEQNPHTISGNTVLELGAGIGCAGIAASFLHPSMLLLTDLAYAVPNIQRNVNNNCTGLNIYHDNGIQCKELDWTNKDTYQRPGPNAHWDVVIGADIVWVEDLIEPLINTLSDVCGPFTSFLLCHQVLVFRYIVLMDVVTKHRN